MKSQERAWEGSYQLVCTYFISHLIILCVCSPSLHDTFFSSLHSNNAEGVRHVLNQVEWTEEASTMMEDLLNNNIDTLCLDSEVNACYYICDTYYVIFLDIIHVESVKFPVPEYCSTSCSMSLQSS